MMIGSPVGAGNAAAGLEPVGDESLDALELAACEPLDPVVAVVADETLAAVELDGDELLDAVESELLLPHPASTAAAATIVPTQRRTFVFVATVFPSSLVNESQFRALNRFVNKKMIYKY